MKLIMESWRKFINEEASEKEIENTVVKTLKDEGGASGLDLLKKSLSDIELPDDFNLDEFLDGLGEVGKHKNGDYILDDEEKIRVMKEYVKQGVDIYLQESEELIDEKNSEIKKLEDMVVNLIINPTDPRVDLARSSAEKKSLQGAQARLQKMAMRGKYNMNILKKKVRAARMKAKMKTNEELETIIDEKRKKRKQQKGSKRARKSAKRKKKKSSGKKDACYHKVKARYDVWPSAYASGALVKCRKVGAANWGNKSKKKNESQEPNLEERCQKGYKTHETRKTKKMYGKTYRNCVKAEESNDPKKGTGKKPKGSGRRLYTDENPKNTVSVKFKSASDIQDTFSKKSFKSKSHKRQSQIINLVHQRVRAAYKNAKNPKVKARLKKAFDYAKKRKEASKEKTKRMSKDD